MSSGTTIHSVRSSVGREAVAFDCGHRYLVVGRVGLFTGMPRCDAEIRRGDELEAVLRREIDSPRDEQTLTLLYRLVGSDDSFAHPRHRRELMIKHLAHAGGARACWVEKVSRGAQETPESVRDLSLGEAPGRDKFIRDLTTTERFHEVLLRSGAHIRAGLDEQWAELTSPEGLVTMVGSLIVVGAVLGIPGGAQVLLGVGFALVGWSVFEAFGHLWEAFRLVRDAKSHEDLDRAAYAFAEGAMFVGLGFLIAFLTRGANLIAPLLNRAIGRGASIIDELTGLPKRGPEVTEPVPMRRPPSRVPSPAATAPPPAAAGPVARAKDAAEEATAQARERAQAAANQAKDAAQDAAQQAKDAAQDAAQEAKDAAQDAVEGAMARAEDAAAATRSQVKQAQAAAQEAAQDAADQAKEAVEETTAQARQAADQTRQAATEAAESVTLEGATLAIEKELKLSGGRSGSKVKHLTGPANSVIPGGGARAFITNDQGQVVRDITRERVKPVIPGKGFGPKRLPSEEELKVLRAVTGGN